MHPATQIRSPGPRQEVKVIGQKNVGVELDLETRQRARQYFQKPGPIRIAGEDSLPPIAPRGDVIDRPLKFQPERPSHPAALSSSLLKCQNI